MRTKISKGQLMVAPALSLVLATGFVAAGHAPVAPTPAAAGSIDGHPIERVSLNDCITWAKGVQRVTHADFAGAIQSVKANGGCADTNAGAICYASRQWWGGWARAVVSWVTNGQSNRC